MTIAKSLTHHRREGKPVGRCRKPEPLAFEFDHFWRAQSVKLTGCTRAIGITYVLLVAGAVTGDDMS
jgi:hypothetical protein